MDLSAKLDDIRLRLSHCDLCPRHCLADRIHGETGYCHVAETPRIYQHFLHFGEEEILTPAFIVNFAGCNLSCPDCPERHRWSTPALPIHSPAHYVHALIHHWQKTQFPKTMEWIGGEPSLNLPFILESSSLLKENLSNCSPIYLNTNVYFEPDVIPYFIDIMDGFVFDLKCTNPCCIQTTDALDYFDIVTHNILSIYSQWNPSYLILRHLVIPGHIDCCTIPIIQWCKQYIPKITFNLMTTFHGHDGNILSDQERLDAISALKDSGLDHILVNGHQV